MHAVRQPLFCLTCFLDGYLPDGFLEILDGSDPIIDGTDCGLCCDAPHHVPAPHCVTALCRTSKFKCSFTDEKSWYVFLCVIKFAKTWQVQMDRKL